MKTRVWYDTVNKQWKHEPYMNLWMDPLVDLQTTHPILTSWDFDIQPYPSWRFGFIDNPDCQFGDDSVCTRTWTQSDSPEQLLSWQH